MIGRDFSKVLTADRQDLLNGQVILLPIQQQVDYQSHLRSSIPELDEFVTVVGYDWQGRPIGLNNRQSNSIILYDTIFDEAMEFPLSKRGFASSSLFSKKDDNFGASEYSMFLAVNKLTSLSLGKCAGFTVPPQLGGAVAVENMELYDVFTYWHYASLVGTAIGRLPVGSTLRSIVVDP